MKILQNRCKHRHTAKTHPHCFVDGSPVNGEYTPKNSKYAKVLVFDIESIPGLFRLWNTGKQYVSAKSMQAEPMILSWAAKWLYDSEVYGKILTPKEVQNRDNSKLMSELWQLMNEADIIVGHNVKGFDIPHVNTWMAKNGFPRPMFYKVVDTLPVARANLKLPSYSLEFINEYFGLTRKLKKSDGLWDRCAEGEKDALEEALEYNKNDVFAEEETYTFLRPWMNNHPELSIYANSKKGGVCVCESTNIEINGYYVTGRGKYAAYRCLDCGAIGRFFDNLLTSKKEEE